MNAGCAQYLLWLYILLAGASAMLGGCGQKGDLYLPEEVETGQQQEP